jgi:hypothetical protein
VTFGALYDIASRGGWVVDLRSGAKSEVMRVSELVGSVLDVGDKDGGVYEGVTLSAFDEASGYLTLEGGVSGSRFRPEDARPLERPLRLWAHDVARGALHEEALKDLRPWVVHYQETL